MSFDDASSSSGSTISEGPDRETDVQLGLPDGGPVASDDERDVEVSRVGGLPSFPALSSAPSPSTATCTNCSEPMELLTQLFSPFPDSPNDRVLYVWGCARNGCQHKPGSVRAWRVLSRNERWARKLERRRARDAAKAAEAKARAEKDEAVKAVNPFAANPGAANPFGAPPGGGLGAAFGAGDNDDSSDEEGAEKEKPRAQAVDEESESEEDESSDEEDESSDEEDEDELAEELEKLAVSDVGPCPTVPTWPARSAYPSQYLNTVPEVLPASASSSKLPKNLNTLPSVDEGSGAPWGKEGYERQTVKGVDDVFTRFADRVAKEPEQVVRYELSGQPLPYTDADPTYKTLFSTTPAPGSQVPVSRTGGQQTHPARYDPSRVPPCPVCKSPRTFECQLMPNLLNLLRPSTIAGDDAAADGTGGADGNAKGGVDAKEKRRRELERMLGQGGAGKREKTGMEWGTVMVFSCLADCCLGAEGEGAREAWREEQVYVQWD